MGRNFYPARTERKIESDQGWPDRRDAESRSHAHSAVTQAGAAGVLTFARPPSLQHRQRRSKPHYADAKATQFRSPVPNKYPELAG